MSETSDITKPLASAIRAIPGCVAHRLHSGKVRIRGGWMQLEPTGTPDLLALVRGLPVYFETKTMTGRVSSEQSATHEELRKIGARVEVVRSVAEGLAVVRQVMEWRNGR